MCLVHDVPLHGGNARRMTRYFEFSDESSQNYQTDSSHRGRLLLTPCNAKRAEPCAQQAVRFVASRTAFFSFHLHSVPVQAFSARWRNQAVSTAQRRVGELKPEICANLRLLIKVFVVGDAPTPPVNLTTTKESPLLLCVGARGFRFSQTRGLRMSLESDQRVPQGAFPASP